MQYLSGQAFNETDTETCRYVSVQYLNTPQFNKLTWMGSRENVAMWPVQRKLIYQIYQVNFSCLFFFHLTSTLLLNVEYSC